MFKHWVAAHVSVYNGTKSGRLVTDNLGFIHGVCCHWPCRRSDQWPSSTKSFIISTRFSLHQPRQQRPRKSWANCFCLGSDYLLGVNRSTLKNRSTSQSNFPRLPVQLIVAEQALSDETAMVAKDDYRPNLAVVDEAFGPAQKNIWLYAAWKFVWMDAD